MEESLDRSMTFERETLRALRGYRNANPWKGSVEDRKDKLRELHRALCSIHGIDVRLNFVGIHLGTHSGNGSYNPGSNAITLYQKLSVITYLHEFAHALNGSCERFACRWSLNLFRKVFPEKFARLAGDSHLAVRR